MNPNPQVYHVTVESAEKRTLINDSDMFFRFLYFFGRFLRFWEVFDPLLRLKVPLMVTTWTDTPKFKYFIGN